MEETTGDHEAEVTPADSPEVPQRWQDKVLAVGEEAQIAIPADEVFTIEGKPFKVTKPIQVRIVRDAEAPEIVYATGESLGIMVAGEGATVEAAVTMLIEIIQQEEKTDAPVKDNLVGVAKLVYEKITGLVVEVTSAQ